MSNLVKYLHSGMPGAPVLSGTAGARIAVLDACLKDGFGLKTVDSLVVTGNVAVASISTGHSAEADTVVLIEGATPAALNGEWRVTATTTNTITFAVPGIADVTATGAMTVKMAPLGWLKPFTGTNLSVYKSADVQSSGVHLRVDDAPTTHSFVRGYESMTDVNTGVGPFPTPVQNATGLYWPKYRSASASPADWIIVGDGRRFYFLTSTFQLTPGTGFYFCWFFGDTIPINSADAFAAVLSGGVLVAEGTTDNSISSGDVSTTKGLGAGVYFVRSFTGIGNAVSGLFLGEGATSSASHNYSGSASYGWGSYPNAANNALLVNKVRVLESPTWPHRSVMPGILHVSQNALTAFVSKSRISAAGDFSGKSLLAINVGWGAIVGVVMFDITGPWV